MWFFDMRFFGHSLSAASLALSLNLIFFLMPAHASEAMDSRCVKILTQSEISTLLSQEDARRAAYDRSVQGAQERQAPALELIQEIEHDHPDGPRYQYRILVPGQFFSAAGSETRNPHASHELTGLVVGETVARILGIEVQGDTVILPSAQRINAGIDRLNRYLPEAEKIRWRYYEDHGKTLGINYLNAITNHQSFPISLDLRIHDINFHLAAIAMPNHIVERILIHAQIAIKFEHFLNAALTGPLPVDNPSTEHSGFERARQRAGDIYRRMLTGENPGTQTLTQEQFNLAVRQICDAIIQRTVTSIDEAHGNFVAWSAIDILPEWWRVYYLGELSNSPLEGLLTYSLGTALGHMTDPRIVHWLTGQIVEFEILERTTLRGTLVAEPQLSFDELLEQIHRKRIALEQAARTL